jgi:hypothetical protein
MEHPGFCGAKMPEISKEKISITIYGEIFD